MTAASNNAEDVARLLIGAKADLNATDEVRLGGKEASSQACT